MSTSPLWRDAPRGASRPVGADDNAPTAGVIRRPGRFELGARLQVPAAIFADTFTTLRTCGDNRRECEVLWTAAWTSPDQITRVVHPAHRANAAGVQLDEAWLTAFLIELAARGEGVRAQVHSHPGRAFHSSTDDAYPAVHTPGFLSLVVPRFAQGSATLNDAFLAEITLDGGWRSVAPLDRLELV